MDKVKITRKQADALEVVRSNPFHSKPEEVIRIHARGTENWSLDVCELASVNLDTLIKALYIGYEVEETPEDKVKILYATRVKEAIQKDGTLDEPYYNGICRGINECLEALNIKIEGVNHD